MCAGLLAEHSQQAHGVRLCLVVQCTRMLLCALCVSDMVRVHEILNHWSLNGSTQTFHLMILNNAIINDLLAIQIYTTSFQFNLNKNYRDLY